MKKITILISFLLCCTIITFADTTVVNVYVHGTQQFGSKMLSKDIWYCDQGLHSIRELPASSMMVKDAKLLQQGDAKNFDLEHYYTFGWSGKLGFDNRAAAGKDLYQEIVALFKQYQKKYNTLPKLRIITFSHGGNVALNMVKYLPFIDGQKIELELVLIACPVQKVTEDLINHPEITQSVVIYSTMDLLQIADYYTYNGSRYLPNRTFETNRSNCFQILVSVNHVTLSHIELCHAFMRHIPEVLRSVDDKDVNSARSYEYNIQDLDFLFYNGFNFIKILNSARTD